MKKLLSLTAIVLITISYSTFAQHPNNAYGDNMKAVDSVQTGPNQYQYIFAMFSGDITQDGSIDVTDFLSLDPLVQNGDGGYLAADLNGDGAVDVSDYLIMDPNIQNGVGVITP